ncbi:pentatricopeptide repeat-containing protein At1g63080, mitochondrial [Hevea brasiliensis]|uniref:pentatricopeptide repeat-containing protein At1g63080, mitochondrial n=1 Tax=Hevea brasiliensis TaxID=3981 RepID=UPI0025E64046|nr:pentatricopeptide repeat-containing protein At1g63080, mitochondrial [Hevea brasiliensis]
MRTTSFWRTYRYAGGVHDRNGSSSGVCVDRCVEDVGDSNLAVKDLNTNGKILKFGLDPQTVTFTRVKSIKRRQRDVYGKWNQALALLNEMVGQNISPNVVSLNELIGSLCKKGMITDAQCKWNQALTLLNEIVGQNISPNVISFNILIDTFLWKEWFQRFKHSQMDEASKVFALMVRNGIVDAFSYNILINGCCKSKRIDEAKGLFNEIPKKCLVPSFVAYYKGSVSGSEVVNCTRGLQEHVFSESAARYNNFLNFAQ